MKTRSCIITLFLISQCVFSQTRKTESNVFKFHPNPAKDHVFILGTNKVKAIEILDILGKSVAIYRFEKSIIKLDISDLKSGIYLLHVTDETEKQEIKRLVVK